MKKKFLIIAVGVSLLAGGGLFLANTSNADSIPPLETTVPDKMLKTVTFDVQGMTCVTCPYTVRKTLQRIDGVTKAEASFETGSATATFDESKTSIDVMLEALKNQGYPSKISESSCEESEISKC